MFARLKTAGQDVRSACRDLDPDELDPLQAADALEELTSTNRAVSGAMLRLARRIDATVTGEDGEADWWAKHTGQSPTDAKKDLEASEQLDGLPATDEAVKNGELSPTQAHEVAAAASEDPSAELALLDTAKNGSVPELRRQAKKVRAAATDDATKNRKAHENRDLFGNTDPDSGEAWAHLKGPAAKMAEFWAHLEPWIQAEFDRARRQDRHERRGAYAFDALMAALAFATAACNSDGKGLNLPDRAPPGSPATVLARIDATALLRGHTVAGETCEIDGLGPVPVDALRDLLPQAAIDLIVTNGVDVFNTTHFGRRANARQQVVLDWLGGECTRQGCGATRHLQVDHRIDWSKIHITELRNLDWLCVPDHRRKTHDGWALIEGTGKRQMVPPGHPDHPHTTTTGADPPDTAAA